MLAAQRSADPRSQEYPVRQGGPLDPTVLRASLLGHLDDALAPLSHGRRPTDSQIHDTRRALKRARALLSLLRPMLSGADHRFCKDRLIDAGRTLADLRDELVLQQTLRRTWRLAGLSPSSPILRSLGPGFGNAGSVPADERRVTCAGIAARNISAARHCLGSTSLLSTGTSPLGARLRKIYRRGRRQFRSLGPSSPASEWHEWRKQVKQYEHILQVPGSGLSGPLDDAARTAHTLADRLGEDHDLAMLMEKLGTASVGKRPAARLVDAIEVRRQALQRRALKIGATLYADPPREIERRLRSALRPTRGRSGRGP
jgi:CHAD domain-containing protein